IAGSNLAESTWVKAGKIVETDENGKEQSMGAIHTSGPQYDRVRGIVNRVMPPYIDRSKVRVYVVDNKEWNAMAMPNFSVYVFTGIIQDLNDDELPLVPAHEIPHPTTHHTPPHQSHPTST